MAVNGTLSKTLAGSNVADVLSGTTTGYDLGIATSDSGTTPTNTVYFKHSGVNSITLCSYYISTYSGIYGGDYSAAVDYAKILSHGDSGAYGLQVEESYSNGTPFNGSYYNIKTTQGSNYSTKRLVQTTSVLYNNATVETAPITPVAGSVGATGDATLGDNVKLRLRYLIPSTELSAGRRQFDVIFTYNFTT